MSLVGSIPEGRIRTSRFDYPVQPKNNNSNNHSTIKSRFLQAWRNPYRRQTVANPTTPTPPTPAPASEAAPVWPIPLSQIPGWGPPPAVPVPQRPSPSSRCQTEPMGDHQAAPIVARPLRKSICGAVTATLTPNRYSHHSSGSALPRSSALPPIAEQQYPQRNWDRSIDPIDTSVQIPSHRSSRYRPCCGAGGSPIKAHRLSSQESIRSFAWPSASDQASQSQRLSQALRDISSHENDEINNNSDVNGDCDCDSDDECDNVSLLEIPVDRDPTRLRRLSSSPSTTSSLSPLPSEYSWARLSVRSNTSTSLSMSRSASIAEVESASAGASTNDSSDTRTLESSIKQFRTEHGRTYHSYGSTEHWGPNDEMAQEQQDISHHFFTILIDGRLFTAPVESPKRILDLGTGTGIWALDVADAYPDAYVRGIDLSPIQPSQTAPNCHFEIDDYNLDFVERARYDLIHQRELLGTVPKWEDFYDKCFNALQPGGWIDITEPDSTRYYGGHEYAPFPDDHLMNLHFHHLNQAGRNSGMVFDIAPQIEGLLKKVGFVNVKVTKMMAPIGAWARGERLKEVGAWNQLRCEEGIVDWSLRRFTNELNWTKEEVVVLGATIRRGYRDKVLKMSLAIYNIVAQKPLDTSLEVATTPPVGDAPAELEG